MATFALIPGAGTDPRVYDATIEALGTLGHSSLAPALPLDDANAAPSDRPPCAMIVPMAYHEISPTGSAS